MKFPHLLRPDQLKALQYLQDHDHLIHIAPTGSGKSLIFQKFIFDRPELRAVLISPLNALSRQLTERFEGLGIPTFRNRMPSSSGAGVWIMSPEKIQGRTLESLRNWNPQFLVVDEAHCVWEWGRDFRPAYRNVLELAAFPSIQKSHWCSATLPPLYQKKLKQELKRLPRNRIKSFGEFKLPGHLTVQTTRISPEIRLKWLRNRLGMYADRSGMIFCNTRASATHLQKYLNAWGLRSFYYHAGLSTEEKLNLEARLKEQRDSSLPIVLIATSAFGMGMDYSFFKFCILFEPPLTILTLVQAIGRIGRVQGPDACPAEAHVLWHHQDFYRNRNWVDQTDVENWCSAPGNPIKTLEKYFNSNP